MKNLKMFAIGLAAMTAMTMGVHATQLPENCKEDTKAGTVTCTLTEDVTLATQTVTKNVTINANGNTVKLTGNLTLDEKSSFTVSNGNLDLDGHSATVGKKATLAVTGANAKTVNGAAIAALHSATQTTVTVNGGTLNISDNNDRGILRVSITLTDGAEFIANNNKENVMNGGVLTVTDSTVTANNNQKGGISAAIILNGESTLTATKNGLSGVVLNGGSKISTKSKIVASGNNWNKDAYDPDRTPAKADVLIAGDLEVAGTLEADSIAPNKLTYGNGDLRVGEITLADSGIVKAKESKEICAGSALTCTDAKAVTVSEEDSEGTMIIGDTATVYGDVDKAEFGSDVKTVVVKSNADIELTVAGGTTVKNETEGKLVVVQNGENIVILPDDEAVIGTALEPEPTNPDTPSAGDGKDPQNPSEPPKTGDNIMAFVGLGIASLAVVGLGTKNLKKQTN